MKGSLPLLRKVIVRVARLEIAVNRAKHRTTSVAQSHRQSGAIFDCSAHIHHTALPLLRKIIVRVAQSLIAVHIFIRTNTALPLLRKIIVRAAQFSIAVHYSSEPTSHYLCCVKSSSERRNLDCSANIHQNQANQASLSNG
jgi:hypothetical protein